MPLNLLRLLSIKGKINSGIAWTPIAIKLINVLSLPLSIITCEAKDDAPKTTDTTG